MPKQAKWLDHHLWVPKTNVTFLAFSHAKDNNLILSSNLGTSVTKLLNNRLLRSFHIIQVHNSQIKCRNDRLAFPKPVRHVNCTKWLETLLESTSTNPIHSRNCSHNDAKDVHDRNKCSAISFMPHPATQRVASDCKIPLAVRFAFIGKRSLRRLQAKIDTFKGTCWCQAKSKALSVLIGVVNIC